MTTEDARNTKYILACQRLVDLAAKGIDIHGMALELKMARRYAQDTRFNETVAKLTGVVE